ncbi:DEAD/DEAH box helicase [Tissierella creatinophila]|uniref:UvrABC system protein B n=1 Tax=Tissierella creatinophila DSM 6911 TaxID=1123403 RepID=A0A1U7M4K7_TISCR|nr:DEAD/DEAH box helicase [Tissierella creatinophila]OLS02247.1 UvrABC system protein B [Tissierella creatinophila DSM 6911]
MELRPYQINLLNKTRKAYLQGFKSPCIVAPCGAGKTVIMSDMAKKATEKGNRVLFLVHRKELKDQTLNTLKWWGADMDYIEVGMVQTIVRRLEKTIKPNLIITDENHHALAKSYRQIYDYFPNAKLVGFTATPIRLNGGGLGDVNDVLVEGPTVDELIEWGNLAPFKYYAPKLVDTDNLRIRAGDYVKKDIEDLFTNKIYGDVVAHYNKLSKGKKAIVYCSGIKQSKEVAKVFNENNIPAKHIDGNTKKEERDKVIQDFRDGKILVLSNVDLVSEGFDIPDCNTTILLRPTKSLGLYIQQSMRSMRYKEGKTAIIIDHVGNVNRFGLPNLDRKWSLETKPGSNETEPAENPVKQCPECYSTLLSNYVFCECGYEFKVEEKEVEIIEDAELEEVTESFVINTKGLEFESPDECKSMKDLSEYAKARNYKQGWVYFQSKSRGWI